MEGGLCGAELLSSSQQDTEGEDSFSGGAAPQARSVPEGALPARGWARAACPGSRQQALTLALASLVSVTLSPTLPGPGEQGSLG